MTGILDLANELVLLVIKGLNPGEIAALARTNRKLFNICDPELYKFVKDSVDGAQEWHPLRWAAEHGQVGTLEKTLAAGVDPNMDFFDSVDVFDRNVGLRKFRIEMIKRSKPMDHISRDPSTERLWQGGVSGEELDLLPYFMRGPRRGDETLGENERHPRFFRAVHLAARGGHDEIIRILLAHGTEVDAQSREICDCQHGSIVPRALIRTRDRNARVPFQATALHLAMCHFQKPSTAGLLLSGGASIQWGSSNTFDTALHTAAATGQTELCQVLLDSHCVQDVDVEDGNGLTPLYTAYLSGHWDSTIPVLLERGANIDFRIVEKEWCADFPGEPYIRSYTMLYEATAYRLYEEAMKLIHLGANVREGKYSNGVLQDTPLCAASRDQFLIVEKDASSGLSWFLGLVGYRPEVLPTLESFWCEDGKSYLDDCEALECKLVQAMIQKGAETDVKGEDGMIPLHLAARRSCNSSPPAALKVLLSSTTKIHIPTDGGRTALMLACLPCEYI